MYFISSSDTIERSIKTPGGHNCIVTMFVCKQVMFPIVTILFSIFANLLITKIATRPLDVAGILL